jgi:hypothetical protein
MTIERPMFPPVADSADSFSLQSAADHRSDETPPCDSPKPTERGAKIISFPSARAPRSFPAPIEFAETGRQRAGRKRNPLRRPYSLIELAVTVAGKIHRGEALRTDDFNDLEYLRRGAEAARLLADELARLVEREG